MEPSQLNSAETVIPLAGLTVSAAMISGSINAAFVTWKYNQVWSLTLIAFFIASIVCWFISKKFASFAFPIESKDQVFVVKAGSSALPLTLKASMIGSILGLVLSGLALSFIIGGTSLITSTWVIVTIISGVIGILWGTLSAII